MNMKTYTFIYDNLKEREREGKIEGKTKKMRKRERGRESERGRDRESEMNKANRSIGYLRKTIYYLLSYSYL